ncbi:aldo/keto reductase [Candidatus Latescibacterota bacterium]
MQKREYGNTGETLSIIGFGGIIVSQTETDEAARLVGEAYDRGINYYDVAPTYGNAQEMLGPALEPYRQDVFLACKTTERTAAGSRRELEESLRLLRTDHIDLYQMHSLNTPEDLATAMGPGGALETFVKARDEGKTRYLGFSSHSAEVAMELMDEFGFDSVLFPVCWVNYFGSGFGPQVIEKAEKKGLARLALKAMAHGKMPEGAERKWKKCWYQPIEDPDLADLALRFALSQPITAAVTPGEGHFLHTAIDIGERFTPITDAEIEELKRQAESSTPIFELAAAG